MQAPARGRFRTLAVACALLCPNGAAVAHHGSAEYKTDKPVVLRQAVVTRFLWANPHAMVLFDVRDGTGAVSHWAGEMGSPASVRELGWTRNSLRPGDVVTVELYPSKFEGTVGRIEEIILADGTSLKNAPRTDRGDIFRY